MDSFKEKKKRVWSILEFIFIKFVKEKMKRFNNYKKGADKDIFNAVWQYLVDHADIDGQGVYFIKFHTNSKEEFAKHIKSRVKGIYRNDLDLMTGLAEKRKLEHQQSILNGMKKAEEKKKVNEVAKNLRELQRNHKTTIYRPSLWEKLLTKIKKVIHSYILQK